MPRTDRMSDLTLSAGARQAARRPLSPPGPRLHPRLLVLAAWACMAGGAQAQAQVPVQHGAPSPSPAAAAASGPVASGPAKPAGPADPTPLRLQASPQLLPPDEGGAPRPALLQAQRIQVRPDLDALAEGAVEFRQAGTVIRADRLSYDTVKDLARATGQVQIERNGARYQGSALELAVQRFEGYFLSPRFELDRLGSGGRAERVDFLDSHRSRALGASYTSCPRDDALVPDWQLRTKRITLDTEANEGLAEGAVLQFLGVPILAAPVLSFPLSDARKSGWLPPTVLPVDSRNGFTLAVPYYWNIAPNRDATLTPTVLTRRGLALDSEFRYLEPRHSGRLGLHLLPHDRALGRSRHALDLAPAGQLGEGLRYGAQWRQVSDDAYWKDFPKLVPSTSPRLLSRQVWLDSERSTPWGALHGYARIQRWQVLQTDVASERITSPYQRSPQLGLRLEPILPWGLSGQLETEVNHFTRPDGSASASLPTGWRWHALGALQRRWGDSAAWVTPGLSLNAASYTLDQTSTTLRRGSRLIPTTSVDAGMVFERPFDWPGLRLTQTLEPRLLWVNTPFRAQDQLPNFDAAERDFNAVSIFSPNSFAGLDRVADAHTVTLGATSRLLSADTGAEVARLGLAQRMRLRDQRVVLSGAPLSQRFSDVLVEGATSVFNPWQLDLGLQYNPDNRRVVRSIVGARYSPAPFKTVSVGYRLARGLSEQFELGWQWPVWRGSARPVGAASGCGGTVYAVGRVNYSMKDSRITDSLAGVEYDSGCWIGRVVAERLSTGRSEATTRLSVQLELVGLSRLGSNPLQVLKDNIPGYRLLREPRGTGPFAEP